MDENIPRKTLISFSNDTVLAVMAEVISFCGRVSRIWNEKKTLATDVNSSISASDHRHFLYIQGLKLVNRRISIH